MADNQDDAKELKNLRNQLAELRKKIWEIEEKQQKECPTCKGSGKIERWPYPPYEGNPYPYPHPKYFSHWHDERR